MVLINHLHAPKDILDSFILIVVFSLLIFIYLPIHEQELQKKQHGEEDNLEVFKKGNIPRVDYLLKG